MISNEKEEITKDFENIERKRSKSMNMEKNKSRSLGRSLSRSLSRSRSRSKSKSNKKIEKSPKDNKNKNYNPIYNYLSKESKKEEKYDLLPLTNFINQNKTSNNIYKVTLFNKKKLSQKLLNEQKDINIEKIDIDQTLHEFQKRYLSSIVNEINKNSLISDEHKEKIIKCGIILTEKEFQDELVKIKDKSLIENIQYQNFKQNLLRCLKYLLKFNENENEDINEYINSAREILGIKKDFEFNNFIDISEENLYYFRLSYDIYKKMFIILIKYNLYSGLLLKLKNFIGNKNLNELNDKDKLYFQIINYYLNDKESLNNESDLEILNQFLSENTINIEQIKKKIDELNSKYNKIKYPKFKFQITDNYIEYRYEKLSYIDYKNKFIETFISKFEIDSFNESFNEIKPKDLFNNLDNDIYKSLVFYKIKSHNNFFYELIPFLKKAILNITNSNAMKKFFEKNYENNYSNIKYDFDQEDVIDEFFNRISLIKIINKDMNAFGDPIDLKIYLPNNPGEIIKLNYIFEVKILRFGRYLILIIHKLLGHMIRRYYYYMSNGAIPQNTKEDKKMNWGAEGGYYFEKNFLGKEFKYISIKDIISLLIPKNEYPILKEGDITIDNLKYVVKEYEKLFEFISLEKNEVSKISINDYFFYLTNPPYSSIKPNTYSYTSFIEI